MGRHRTIDDEAILAIAREIFLAQGHTATTREVAQAAGISQGVLYQRFGSKDDLFFAALLPPAPNMTALFALPEGMPDDDVQAYLLVVGQRILTYFVETFPAVMHLMTHPAFATTTLAQFHTHLPMTALVTGLAEHIAQFAARGVLVDSNSEATARTLLAVLHGIALLEHLGGSSALPTREAQVRQVVQLLCYGLLPRGRNSD